MSWAFTLFHTKMKKILIAIAIFAFSVGVAATASAQTAVTVNPQTVSFTASTDHDAVLSDGQQIVQRYEMRLFYRGATQPANVVDLGKPTPNAERTITATNPLWFRFSQQYMNVEGVAKVAAIGIGGESVSAPSGPFAVVGPPTAPTNVATQK